MANALIVKEEFTLASQFLKREVAIQVFVPQGAQEYTNLPLLVLNDGQDSAAVGIRNTLQREVRAGRIPPMAVVGVEAGDRMAEFGTAHRLDYLKRGALAKAYSRFVVDELMVWVRQRYPIATLPEATAIAGYSLGGLSAMDIAWNHAHVFGKAGMFSASFWWRRYTWYERIFGADAGRLMIRQIRRTRRPPALKCWFQAGTLDEADDRNQNGIIDAIDDTLDVMAALTHQGYRPYYDYTYHEVPRGRHHPDTWKEAMPHFLRWAYGVEK